jgi:hypothetical protein
MKTKFLQEKAAETVEQKEAKRKIPEPEEQEGMPQHQVFTRKGNGNT